MGDYIVLTRPIGISHTRPSQQNHTLINLEEYKAVNYLFNSRAKRSTIAMHQKITSLGCLIFCLLCSNTALSDHEAHRVSRELAHLLINFSEQAKPTERSTLVNIMNSPRASSGEKELAHIMLITKQQADLPSRQRLLSITQDSTQDPFLRELAHVFFKLEKQASESERRYLKTLLRRQRNHHGQTLLEQLLSHDTPEP